MFKKVLILASVIEGPQIKLIKKRRNLSVGIPAEKENQAIISKKALIKFLKNPS